MRIARDQPYIVELETPHGPARAHVDRVADAGAALVLGHGAGGGIAAPDLVAVRRAAVDLGIVVARLEQPYRVAGRRSPPPARQLDDAWIAAVHALQRRELRGLPLVAGGRSSGARVACRTAAAVGAAGVLCLAFPLHPPPRREGTPAVSRLPELDGVAVPVLVVQGERDRFGMPRPRRGRTVVRVAADHALRSDLATIAAAARAWLRDILAL